MQNDQNDHKRRLMKVNFSVHSFSSRYAVIGMYLQGHYYFTSQCFRLETTYKTTFLSKQEVGNIIRRIQINLLIQSKLIKLILNM